ncbi:MAG: hypothetical protein M3384_02040 [Acidobacteriota bacterium]|nr:hypothetical protein [Acidobacteriota bacterium]
MNSFIRFFILILFCAGLFVVNCKAQKSVDSETKWQVEPSLKYDTLCFLNVLTGDSFYQRFYAKEYARFEPHFTPQVRSALTNLKSKVKDENKNIVSAFLSLHFSASNAETLDDMLNALDESKQIKVDLQKTVYYTKDGWRLFESIKNDLRIVLRFLQTERFDVYWREEILPKVREKVGSISEYLSNFDVVREVEKHLRFELASKKIIVFALYFSRPHGIRLTGNRFVTDISYPTQVVLRVAIHELLHPPYDLSKDRELKKTLETLRSDEFLTSKIRNHNPAFGYNSFESFVEENCVRALDQIIGEKLGIKNDARQRWRDEDDGIHVLAAVLYDLMRQDKYDGRKESFRNFLFRVIRTGKLSTGKIKSLYDNYYFTEQK